jgi:HK97 family phage prohead protease
MIRTIKRKKIRSSTMKAKDKEIRAYMCDVSTRSDEKHGNILEGIPIIYDAETDIGGMWKEIIDRGALDEADLKDVRFLVNHDVDSIPLARSRNNNENSTMQMTIEEDGLHVRVDLDTEGNPRAKELYSAIKRQDVSGMSFMFNVKDDKWDDLDTDYPTRHITALGKVFEVSAVTFPAYEQTSINARSLESGKASLDSAREALENARKNDELRKAIIERCKK